MLLLLWAHLDRGRPHDRLPLNLQESHYFWQFGQDGVLWTDAPQTLQARTSLSGLTGEQTYWFRVRVMTKGGEGDFGEPVSLLVE